MYVPSNELFSCKYSYKIQDGHFRNFIVWKLCIGCACTNTSIQHSLRSEENQGTCVTVREPMSDITFCVEISVTSGLMTTIKALSTHVLNEKWNMSHTKGRVILVQCKAFSQILSLYKYIHRVL